jgi:purine-binding chemotaxis protein CheW
MNASHEVCTFEIAGHFFGINATDVQEIMSPQRVTRVPLARPGIAGLLNVRGELVTAIDLRQWLELPLREAGAALMNIVLRTGDGGVSLLVDAVGEVMRINDSLCEPVPPTLRGPARALTEAVVKLPGRLLLRLNMQALIGTASAAAAPV